MKLLKRKRQSQQGQSLIEFALTLPILVLILSGLLDLGRAYFTFIALEEAAAEGALYLAIDPACPSESASGFECDNPNNALYRANSSGNNEFDPTIAQWNIPYDSIRQGDANFIDPRVDECSNIGCTLAVQVRYPYDFLTPGMEALATQVLGDDGLILEVAAYQLVVFNQR